MIGASALIVVALMAIQGSSLECLDNDWGQSAEKKVTQEPGSTKPCAVCTAWKVKPWAGDGSADFYGCLSDAALCNFLHTFVKGLQDPLVQSVLCCPDTSCQSPTYVPPPDVAKPTDPPANPGNPDPAPNPNPNPGEPNPPPNSNPNPGEPNPPPNPNPNPGEPNPAPNPNPNPGKPNPPPNPNPIPGNPDPAPNGNPASKGKPSPAAKSTSPGSLGSGFVPALPLHSGILMFLAFFLVFL